MARATDVALTATLTQGLATHYESATGWRISAPGTLDVSATAEYSALWDFPGLSGSHDLFHWNVASWDFLPQSGTPLWSDGNHTAGDNLVAPLWVDSSTNAQSSSNSSVP